MPMSLVDSANDPALAVEILRQLGADIRALYKATVFCRLQMGRHLTHIQKNELWRGMERRDYRHDPEGKPMWLSPQARFYSTWYNFVEEGFERITGLHRQTAYSSIKLAQSAKLSKLSRQELSEIKRLANALELVCMEKAGVDITPELIKQAKELSIKQFRKSRRSLPHAVKEHSSILTEVVNFLKAATDSAPEAVERLWMIIRDAMIKANEDPARALEDILMSYRTLPTKVPGPALVAGGTTLDNHNRQLAVVS